MATLTSTQPDASSDYVPYIYDSPVKTDRIGDPDLLDFTLAPTDSNFVRLKRGAYITFQTTTYGTWFTGYISNDPEFTFLGKDPVTKKPVWGYKYEAESDEIILNEQSLGIQPPFLNKTQGEILASLANTLMPNWFNTTGIQDGLFLARYVVDPTKKFGDIVKEFSQNAVYRFYAKSGALNYVPQDAGTSCLTIDHSDKVNFSPDQLDIRASKIDVINDAIVIGGIEPQDYVTEYFAGDGFTAQFPLMDSVFGVESAVLLDETFQGNTLSGSNWTVYDLPSSKLVLSNGFLNVIGGSMDGNFDVHLDSANLITVEGNLRLTHGDYDFVDAATTTGLIGVVGGLWTQAPNPQLTGCICGFAVYRDSSDNVTLQSIVNGAIVNSTLQTINMQMRYVLRTTLASSVLYSVPQVYPYLSAAGTNQQAGANVPLPTGNLTVTHMVSEIDPTYGMLTDSTIYPKYDTHATTVPGTTQYALYVPAASSDLHVTITNITVSTPMQASLAVNSGAQGSTSFSPQLVGPNEVDALDGLTPAATVVQSGGVTQKSTILGTPSYNASNATLTFFKDSINYTDTIPGVGSKIQLQYRAAGAAIGRARDNTSVLNEASTWGDSGIRSSTNSNANPAPRTSADCESAASATVGELAYTRYEGTYTCWNDVTVAEPVSGTILPFVNMPTDSFVSASFGESLYQVQTTFVSAKPMETFQHVISFGKATDQEQLRKVLSKLQNQPDVFLPSDSTQVPDYVPSSSVGTAYATDVTYLTLGTTAVPSGIDSQGFHINIPVSPSNGGGFEVRSTNDSWGADPGKNLIQRLTGANTFLVPRNDHNKVVFVRAYDIRNHLLYSEDLTQTAWVKTGGMTVTSANGFVPGGDYGPISGFTLAGSNGSSVYQLAAVSASSGITQAVFSASIKGVNGKTVILTLQGAGANKSLSLTCTGGWQRVSVSTPISGAPTSATLQCVISKNDAGAHTVQVTEASLEINTSVETVYVKTTSIPYGANSRYTSAIRINYPMIPPPPLTVEVTPAQQGNLVGTDPTVPAGLASSGMLVTPTMPLVGEDVWGFEIRTSPTGAAVYHCDLSSSSYQPTITLPIPNYSTTYYVYTYNLFGEYSTAYTANPDTSPPSVSNLVVNDATQLFMWQYTHCTQFQVDIDSVDNTFTHLTNSVMVQNNFYALQDTDFYNFRWLRVTPMDSVGSGTPMSISHQYAPTAIDPLDPGTVGSQGSSGGISVGYKGPRPVGPSKSRGPIAIIGF